MLTVKQATQLLGISRSKLYQLISARKLVHYRIGGKILLDEADLNSYLVSCRVIAGSMQMTGARNTGRSTGAFRHLNAAKLVRAWEKQGAA